MSEQTTAQEIERLLSEYADPASGQHLASVRAVHAHAPRLLRAALSALHAADERIQALEGEREVAGARLCGMRAFLSGQPHELPYRKGEYAKSTTLNVAWSMGYCEAQESDVFKMMVNRADRTAAKLEASEAALRQVQEERDAAVAAMHAERERCQATYKAQAQTEAALRQVREALAEVKSTSRGYLCWCDASHNAVEYGHQPKCQRATEALAAQPTGETKGDR